MFRIEGHSTYRSARDAASGARYIGTDVYVSSTEVVMPFGASAVARACDALDVGGSVSFRAIPWESGQRCADAVTVTRER